MDAKGFEGFEEIAMTCHCPKMSIAVWDKLCMSIVTTKKKERKKDQRNKMDIKLAYHVIRSA